MLFHFYRRKRRTNSQYAKSEDLILLKSQAKAYIPQRVEHFAKIIGVNYKNVQIRCQRTLWGSCSSSGTLSFNCLLMKCPPSVIDYVVVHELCHRIHMNHSKAFWQEVEKYCPDYKTQRAWLKSQGLFLLQSVV